MSSKKREMEMPTKEEGGRGRVQKIRDRQMGKNSVKHSKEKRLIIMIMLLQREGETEGGREIFKEIERLRMRETKERETIILDRQ